MELKPLLKRVLTSTSLFLAGASLLSRALGLIRDRLLTHTFGATRLVGSVSELDAYYAAFQLPDLLYQILIMGTISACFVPYFTDLYKKNHDQAWKLSNNTLSSLVIVMLILVSGCFMFSKQLISLFTVGMAADGQQLTLQLTHIMLLSPLLFSLSGVTGAISHSLKRFAAFALAPILYNLSIIVGLVFLAPRYGIYGVSIGVVIGAVFHAGIQAISAWRGGFRFQPFIDWKDKVFLAMVKSSFPRILSMTVGRINILVDTTLASMLVAGSITILNLAQNIQSLPLGIIGVSVAVASFPFISELVSDQKHQELGSFVNRKIEKMLYILLPVTLVTILLRTEIVRLLFGSGRFNWTDTITTADTLGLFALSFISESIQPIITRTFYAYKNTRDPLLISLYSIVINIIGSVILVFVLHGSVIMLGLSFSIASIFELSMQLYRLAKKHNLPLWQYANWTFITKTIIATIITTIVAQASKFTSALIFDPLDSVLKVAGKISFVLIFATATYLISQYLLGNYLTKVLDLAPTKQPEKY